MTPVLLFFSPPSGDDIGALVGGGFGGGFGSYGSLGQGGIESVGCLKFGELIQLDTKASVGESQGAMPRRPYGRQEGRVGSHTRTFPSGVDALINRLGEGYCYTVACTPLTSA